MKKIRLSIALALLLNIMPTAQAQVCTREYAPVCGQVLGESVAQTFSNRCLLKAANAKELAQGQCAIEQLKLVGGDTDEHGCKSSAGYLWNEALMSCVRPWLSIALTLEVAAQRRPCHGLFEKQCLVVREVQDSRSKNRGQAGQKWEPLFDEIAGFKKVPGKRYLLRVRKDRLENPPLDASDTNYTLLRVIKEQ
jgi:hypothetical protein